MSGAGINIGVGVDTQRDPLSAGTHAATRAAGALGGSPVDLALVFASGSHLEAPEATLQGVHEVLAPGVLIGCGAAGVLGDGHEHESGSAVAVWAASLGPGGRVVPSKPSRRQIRPAASTASPMPAPPPRRF